MATPHRRRLKASRELPIDPLHLVPLERQLRTPDARVYVNRSKLNTPDVLAGKMTRT